MNNFEAGYKISIKIAIISLIIAIIAHIFTKPEAYRYDEQTKTYVKKENL